MRPSGFSPSLKDCKLPICGAALAIKKMQLTTDTALPKVRIYLKSLDCLEGLIIFFEDHHLFSQPRAMITWLTKELEDRAMPGIGSLQRSYLSAGSVLVQITLDDTGPALLEIPCNTAERTGHLA